jgi:hypothetical protein
MQRALAEGVEGLVRPQDARSLVAAYGQVEVAGAVLEGGEGDFGAAGASHVVAGDDDHLVPGDVVGSDER